MKKKLKDTLYHGMLLVAGSALTAFAVKAFIVPQEFVARGVTGITLLIYYKTTAVSLGMLYFLINIPIFILGWKFVGTRFTLYSILGMLIYSAVLGLVPFQFHLADKMLAAVIAGGVSGIGLAIVLRSYGSCGGADILYVIINKFTSLSIGAAAMIINGCIIAATAFLFPLENLLYTIIYVAVNMYVSNRVFQALDNRQSVLIVSEKWREITEKMSGSRIGVTTIEGKGGYKGTPRTILYSVINRDKLIFLKRAVLKTDPGAFITVMNADDVTGFEIGNQPHW
jgi:uncharacterized membrane-anchored protein YitT (DUF2179 family)